jgi:hypothetical protein
MSVIVHILKLVSGAALGLAVVACAPAAKPAATEASTAIPHAPPAEVVAPAQTTDIAFNLALKFSDRAKAKIKELDERVLVNAMYYGAPLPGIETEEGGFNLGEEVQEMLAEDQTVPFTGTHRIDVGVGQTDGAPRVLVNVYTARRVHPDNLLDCGIVDDALPVAASVTFEISCKLIEES